jgi:hypothetical protein
MFLASPTFWSLHCSLCFTLTASCIISQGLAAGSLTLSYIVWPSKLSFEIWVKASMKLYSCIFHACKTSITWMMPKSSGSGLPWTTVAVVSEYLSSWA